jgi:hypothetical protein
MFSSTQGFYPPAFEFLVVGTSGNPALVNTLQAWDQTNNSFTSWGNATPTPNSAAFMTSVSVDGQFVAITGTTPEPFLIYQVNGSQLTQLPAPGNVPTDTGFGVHFDNTNTYLAQAGGTNPTLRIYKRSGTTFTLLPDPAVLPSVSSRGLMWDPSSTYLCVLPRLSSTAKMLIYKRSGDTLTDITANIDTVPSVTNPPGVQNTLYCHWSHDSTYLSVGMEQSPFLYIYKRTGDNFALLSSPLTPAPDTNTRGAFFSPDSTYLVQMQQASPFVRIYKRSGDTWDTSGVTVDSLPADGTNGVSVSWTPDSKYVALATGDNTKPLAIYLRTGDSFTLISGNLVSGSVDGRSANFYPRAPNGA